MGDVSVQKPRIQRVSYLSGPTPVTRFLDEMQGAASSFAGTNYMKQFISLVESYEATADIVAWYGNERFTRTVDKLTIYNRPLPAASGIWYHFSMIGWHLQVLLRWVRYRPNIVVVTGNHDFWWVLSPLRLLGARIIPSYHSTLWPKLRPRRFHKAVYAWLNSWLVLRSAPSIVSTSTDITMQVKSMLGPSQRRSVLEHLPTYSCEQFDDVTIVSELQKAPFTVIFTGRIEVNKGVFDILAVADRLEKNRPGQYKFHYCGEGSQSERLSREIARLGLLDSVTYHGHCDLAQMKQVFSQSHVAVVPTHSDFEAGFEMTCCEAILCGRPLIASRACPALHYLKGAAIAITPDSIDELYDAIVVLSNEQTLYNRLAGQCSRLANQFYDPENSWYSVMNEAFKSAFDTPADHAATYLS